jgi:hypothetical protein
MPTADDNAYYIAFGRFIHWYARVEAETHGVFEWCSDFTRNEARAITGGMRLADIMSITKRLVIFRKNADAQKEIESLYTQLATVSQLRDLLIHRGADAIGDTAYITNVHTARTKADWEILDVKISEIKDAADDCARIWIRIRELIDPDPKSAYADGDAAKWLAQPWRYKHRQPKFPHRLSGRGSTTRSRKPRDASSRG